jgi:SAM-dependent methyltransferase
MSSDRTSTTIRKKRTQNGIERILEDTQLQRWNAAYASRRLQKPAWDDWPQKHMPIIRNARLPALDLGCGAGGNAFFLSTAGHFPICGDYSMEALRKIRSVTSFIPVVLFDMRQGLPFRENVL